MEKLPISVTIIAHNEEKRIAEAILSVKDWTSEVVVMDSGSIDNTRKIAEGLGARVEHRPWEGYGQQKNAAQNSALQPWILNIDADERVSPELREEMAAFFKRTDCLDFSVAEFPRKNYLGSKWIRHGGWYPNRVRRLYQKSRASWTEPSIHETLTFEGRVYPMSAPLVHYSFADLGDQAQKNVRYAALGASVSNRAASYWSMCFKPLVKWIECYLMKFGFLDGFHGFVIAINAAYSVFLRESLRLEKVKHTST